MPFGGVFPLKNRRGKSLLSLSKYVNWQMFIVLHTNMGTIELRVSRNFDDELNNTLDY